MRPPRRVQLLIGAGGAASLAYVVGLLVVPRPESGYLTLWDGWLFFPASAVPVALLVWRAVDDADRRLSWALLAAGTFSTWSADLVYVYRDANLDEWRFPAPSDLLYLTAYPLWMAGIVTLAYRSERRRRSRVLDGFTVGLTVGALAVVRWFGPIFDQSGSAADVALGITFAVLDLLLIVLAISTLAPQGFRPSPATLGLVVGASVFAVGDLVYLNRIATSDYSGGTWLESLWLLGMWCFAISAWLPLQANRRRRSVGQSMPGLVPAGSSIVALGIVAVGLVNGVPDAIPGLAAAMAVAAVALALVRVLWTMRELQDATRSFEQARTDDLTGLGNRRAFMEAVDGLLARAPGPVTVLMVDLDGFKDVNDTLGHQAGDHLLREVADRLSDDVPDHFTLARLGGDEFGVALAASAHHGEELARRLLAQLGRPVLLDALTVRVSGSVGIATCDPPGTTRADLMRMADVAMYDAKDRGVGWAHYRVSSDPHSPDRLRLVDDLCRAVEDRSLELHLQPVIELATGRVVSLEALVRWEHPERGSLLPDSFIGLAERAGVMPQVTAAVVELAAGHLTRLIAAGLDVSVSINISARDLLDPGLCDRVVRVFADVGAPLDRLTVEITENALTTDVAHTTAMLAELRALGVRVAIDDFGVGYSSLTQLLQLPVDELKLDRSFIAPIDQDHRAQAIVRSAVELGRTLGLTVVAEGVETSEALRLVHRHGVDRAQGFHLAAPMAIDEVLAFAAPAQEPLHGGADLGR